MTNKAAEIIANSDKLMLGVYPHALGLVFSHADGCRIYDENGQEFIDFSSGLGVCALGFNNPEIKQEALKVLESGVHSSNLFYHAPQLELATLLTSLARMDRAYFSNSGAEANEAGIKALRKFGSQQSPKRYRIICFENGWHGRSMATISACRDESMQAGFDPLLPGFDPVSMFDLREIEQAITAETVGVLIEPVVGHGGIFKAPDGFLKDLRELCDRYQLKLMLDEIQSGLGRCGHLFYHQCEQIIPDVMTLAKPLGNGFPIGATLFSEDIAQYMTVGTHGSATGGNILATSVACHVVKTISQSSFLTDINEKGRFLDVLLKQELLSLAPVCSVRVVGLLAGIDVTVNAKQLSKHLVEYGLITTTLGNSCLRLMPPLLITEADLREGVSRLKAGIQNFIA